MEAELLQMSSAALQHTLSILLGSQTGAGKRGESVTTRDRLG